MPHIGINKTGLVEIVDGHTVITMTFKEAHKFFTELERMLKWIDKKERKK